MPMSDDEFFIRKTLETDPRLGVELLFKRYYQPLCTHAVKFVGSREVAEDLVAELFYQFYSTNAFERITSSYRLYLLKTVRNRAYNYLKWELRHNVALDEAQELPSGEEGPDGISQFEEMYQDMEGAISALPVECRRIFLLKRFEGKKAQDIADELKLSVRTVETQLYRANQQIRALLKDKWPLLVLLVSWVIGR